MRKKQRKILKLIILDLVDNSNELFIRFNLQILDTNPDYVILMHGYNDIIPYFTSNFSSDYFNSRKSLQKVIGNYYLYQALKISFEVQ